MKLSLPGAACAISFTMMITAHSTAALIDRGGDLIYDTELDITWLQDANYAKTSGFHIDGRLIWPTAMSWAANLSYYDAARNKTWTDWRLPSARDKGSSSEPCFLNNCTESELGHLYHIDGINKDSPGPFTNFSKNYWSGTGRIPFLSRAWLFAFGPGQQDYTGPLENLLTAFAWAVRDGDVDDPVNLSPLAANDTASVDEGQSVTIDLTLNDTDADDGLDLGSIRIANDPLNGNITAINTDGTVDYTHNGSETTTDSFSYTVSDLNTASSNEATVTITINPTDTNGDGISDAQATILGLDPNDADGDTDNDQITDVAEVGGDLNNPIDSDADGMIDALEPGTSAADASVVSGLQFDDGTNLIIQTATGEALSNASSEVITDGPAEIDFPFGMMSYTTTAPTGGSATVRLSFSNDLPENLVVFKVDNAGGFTELPATLWTQLDARTLEVTLTDGDPVTDLDGASNGSIDDPIAVGGGAPVTPVSNGSGGGGGCTLNAAADKDPTLLLLMWLSLGYLLRRRIYAKK